ncbi:hypothetical protein NDU88_010993 [Pleurodeles waltl]|uniref:Uncharacterized protein n=1 Tax=Pleurodeles waltl TaxID=8319 RepID=A0AAV7PXN2_PLEWA|nr:hypothetical protein NDU88_010993 [Pleurodeles waltl]
MPSSKSVGKSSHQLIFSEAVYQHRLLANQQGSSAAGPPTVPPCQHRDTTMESILQEITVVSRRMKGVASKISDIMAEIKPIHVEITDFQDRVKRMEQQLAKVKGPLNNLLDRDQEFLYLRDKVTDLEDRSHRGNICFFGT